MALPANPFADKNCIQKDNTIRKSLESKMSKAGTDLEILDAELDNVMQGKMKSHK